MSKLLPQGGSTIMYGNTYDLSTCDLVSYVPRRQKNRGSNFDIGGSGNKSEQSCVF